MTDSGKQICPTKMWQSYGVHSCGLSLGEQRLQVQGPSYILSSRPTQITHIGKQRKPCEGLSVDSWHCSFLPCWRHWICCPALLHKLGNLSLTTKSHVNMQRSKARGWETGSGVKSTVYSSRGHRIKSQHLHSASPPSAIPAPEDPTLSPGFFRHQARTLCPDIY